MVGLDRVERSTSPLSGARSNQLSYRPKLLQCTTNYLPPVRLPFPISSGRSNQLSYRPTAKKNAQSQTKQ